MITSSFTLLRKIEAKIFGFQSILKILRNYDDLILFEIS